MDTGTCFDWPRGHFRSARRGRPRHCRIPERLSRSARFRGRPADLTEACVEIERIALARSIARCELEWETNLVAAWHRLSKISERLPADQCLLDQWVTAHARFHAARVAACGSNKLLQVRSQLYQQSERYRLYFGVVDSKRDVFAEHRRIFEVTIARDGASAQARQAIAR